MKLYKDQVTKLLDGLGENITVEIEEKTEFMYSLMETDNWTMIIKSHALIEALVS